MAWLDRLNDRQTRLLARNLHRQAFAARDLAQDHLGELAHEANDLARSAARQVADYGRSEGADVAREAVQHYARRAGELAGRVADYGRHEGAVLAEAATIQALRAGRAVKADPVPVIVGAVGLALLANLLFGRRRA